MTQIVKLHQYGIMSAPTMSQYAAIEAMQYGDEDIAAMREEYDGRRRFLLDGFRSIGLECFEPKGAFYMFPSIQSSGMDSDTFCTEVPGDGARCRHSRQRLRPRRRGLLPGLLRRVHPRPVHRAGADGALYQAPLSILCRRKGEI